MDKELKELENYISEIAPNSVPKGMLERMEQAMCAWQDTQESTGEEGLENVREQKDDSLILADFEKQLQQVKPQAISEQFAHNLDQQLTQQTHEVNNPLRLLKKTNYLVISAAALLVLGLFISSWFQKDSTFVQTEESKYEKSPEEVKKRPAFLASDIEVIPQGSNIIQVIDSEIITPKQGDAYREIYVRYHDLYQGKQQGRTYHYTKDRMRSYKVPVKFN